MKKIIVLVAWAILLLGTSNARAGEYVNGAYLGGKIGINYSAASGAVNASNKGSVAYILQGAYLHGGYVFESKTLVFSVGGYFDLNPSDKHDSGVTYGSRSVGLNAKVGLPLGAWMPYTMLGYGYSTGTKDLGAVAQNSLNAGFGLEYKIDPQFSLLGEYKADSFSGGNVNTKIHNKTITFGFNYYFQAPPVVAAPVVVEVEEVEAAPAPVVVPVPVEDAPPI